MPAIQTDVSRRYSFSDYLTWMDDKRRELIDGFVKRMSPAPSKIHQQVSLQFSLQFGNYLRDKTCELFYAPFDVRFPDDKEKEDAKIFTVVQPDICVICDQQKLDEKGCLGPPDLIIEIVSDNNPERDVEEKYTLYQAYGVKEYWVVFPFEKTVNVFFLDKEGRFQLQGMYSHKSTIKVNIFADLEINLKDVFSE